ncbi:MAG: AAA family ATPase, partial [Mesorhizobium sp.]
RQAARRAGEKAFALRLNELAEGVECLRRRVLVDVCAGSGKSTLAQALSVRLDLPYRSMDREFFWLPGWKPRGRAEIKSMVAKAVGQDRWIMDGSNPPARSTCACRAPTPCSGCAYRACFAWRSQPDVTEGCPEKVDLEVLSYIWNFEKEDGLKIRDALARHGPDVPVFILDSRGDAGALLALLERRDTD